MVYQKLTLEGFKQRLEFNQYKTAGAAYKAIGKSTLPDKEKAAGKELIEKAFFEKEAAKVVVQKRKYTRRTPLQTKLEKKEAPKGAEEISRKAKAATPLSIEKQIDKAGIAKDRVDIITQAIGSLKEAKKLQPKLDIAPDIKNAKQVLASIIASVQEDLNRS